MTQLFQLLNIHGNTIIAILIKEINVRFSGKKLAYLWFFLEPLLHIAPFFLIRIIASSGKWDEILLLMATGFFVILLYRKIATKLQSAISANKALFAYRRVNVFSVTIARLILEVLISMSFVLLIAFILTVSKSNAVSLGSIHAVFFAFLLLIILSFATGIIFMVIIQRLPMMDTVLSMVLRFLYFTSGAFFAVQDLPYKLRDVFLLNPLLNIVDIVRYNIMTDCVILYGSLSYVGSFAFVLLFVAFFVLKVNKYKLL